jgi:hypothetical protein
MRAARFGGVYDCGAGRFSGGAGLSGCPHSLQYRLPEALTWPHARQRRSSEAPQLLQNLAGGGFACPHCGHAS